MPRKPRGDKFGEGLEVEYTPGDLRLVIHPSRSPWRSALRLFLLTLPLLVLVFAPTQQLQQLYQHLIGLSANVPSQMPALMKWAAAFVFSIFLHFAGRSMGKKRYVRFSVNPPSRLGRWVSKLTESVPEDSLRITLRTGGGIRSYSSERSRYIGLRIQPDGFEDLPVGEHAHTVHGPGDQWLRFETSNYEPFAINLPVDDEHVHRLAGMLGEVFGQECPVMQSVTEAEVSETDMPTRLESGT